MKRKNPQRQLQSFYQLLKKRVPWDLQRFSWLKGPDLIWIDAQYLESRPRIAIIGQQTGDWYYSYPEFIKRWSVQDAIKEYRKFNFACSEEGEHFRRSPFWRFFGEIRKAAFPEAPDAQRNIVWTNLIKFVARGGTAVIWEPYADAEPAMQIQEDILCTELEIAKPDVCIFVTGPNYDFVLRRYFRGVEFDALPGVERRKLARLSHPKLPPRSYRCYHPEHLSRNPKLWIKTLRLLKNAL